VGQMALELLSQICLPGLNTLMLGLETGWFQNTRKTTENRKEKKRRRAGFTWNVE